MSSSFRGRGGRDHHHGHGGRGRGRGSGGGAFGDRAQLPHRMKADGIDASASQTGYSEEGSDCDSRGGASDTHFTPAQVLPVSSLEALLRDMDGSNYVQLKQLTGRTYSLTAQAFPHPSSVAIRFSRIQPDPFAPGSQVCIIVPSPFSAAALLHSPSSLPTPHAPDRAAAPPLSPEDVAWRRVAAEDFILRCVHRGLAARNTSGALQVTHQSQHVLPRSTVQLVCGDEAVESDASPAFLRIHLRVKLPGHGRRIDSCGIHRILFSELLPIMGEYVLQCSHLALWSHVTCVHDQEWLRGQLHSKGLVAFVVDGAVLPRAAGDSDTPLTGPTVVPFHAPQSLACSFTLPYSRRPVSGMGLPRGLTLVAGGGFHGKSTLLRALELGVYNHVPDDGRTFVVVDATAVKIRAEDRRSVSGVDISPFIRNLPFQTDTTAFSTRDASGSTSQAAGIIEALELGSTALLLDEDTSATNFMYRDAMMEQLVPPPQEPITAFVHRVRDLIQHHGVSVILVVGGSGQYFPMADVVLVMNAYHVRDATAEAKAIVQRCTAGVGSCDGSGGAEGLAESSAPPCPPQSAFCFPPARHLNYGSSFKGLARRTGYGRGGGALKSSGSGLTHVRFGEETIHLALVEQLVEEGQLNAIAQCLALLYDEGSVAVEALQKSAVPSPVAPPPLWSSPRFSHKSPSSSLALSDYSRLVHNCEGRLRQARLELQTRSCFLPTGFTSLPRVFEIGAALNRLRTIVAARK